MANVPIWEHVNLRRYRNDLGQHYYHLALFVTSVNLWACNPTILNNILQNLDFLQFFLL